MTSATRPAPQPARGGPVVVVVVPVVGSTAMLFRRKVGSAESRTRTSLPLHARPSSVWRTRDGDQRPAKSECRDEEYPQPRGPRGLPDGCAEQPGEGEQPQAEFHEQRQAAYPLAHSIQLVGEERCEERDLHPDHEEKPDDAAKPRGLRPEPVDKASVWPWRTDARTRLGRCHRGPRQNDFVGAGTGAARTIRTGRFASASTPRETLPSSALARVP